MSKFNVEPLCRLNELKDLSIINERSFVVSSVTNREIFVFLNEGDANSDRVRSRFASLTGSKFTDTRCKMLKNAWSLT